MPRSEDSDLQGRDWVKNGHGASCLGTSLVPPTAADVVALPKFSEDVQFDRGAALWFSLPTCALGPALGIFSGFVP